MQCAVLAESKADVQIGDDQEVNEVRFCRRRRRPLPGQKRGWDGASF
jgi:hypothetical protein